MQKKTWLALMMLPLLGGGCADKPSRSDNPGPAAESNSGGAASTTTPKRQAAKPAATLSGDQVERLSPKAVQKRVAAGALLVCAYQSDAKFSTVALQGAISRAAFQKARATTAKDTLLVFYCS